MKSSDLFSHDEEVRLKSPGQQEGLTNKAARRWKTLGRVLAVAAALQCGGGLFYHKDLFNKKPDSPPSTPRYAFLDDQESIRIVRQALNRLQEWQLGNLKRGLRAIEAKYGAAKREGDLLLGNNREVWQIRQTVYPIWVIRAFPTPSNEVVGLGFYQKGGNSTFGIFILDQNGSVLFAPFPAPLNKMDFEKFTYYSHGFGNNFAFVFTNPFKKDLPNDIRIKESSQTQNEIEAICFVSVGKEPRITLCFTGTQRDVVFLNEDMYLGNSTSRGMEIIDVNKLGKENKVIDSTELDDLFKRQALLLNVGKNPVPYGNDVINPKEAIFLDSEEKLFIVKPASNGFQVAEIPREADFDKSRLLCAFSFLTGINYMVTGEDSVFESIFKNQARDSSNAIPVLSAWANGGVSGIIFYDATRMLNQVEILDWQPTSPKSKDDEILTALQNKFNDGIILRLGSETWHQVSMRIIKKLEAGLQKTISELEKSGVKIEYIKVDHNLEQNPLVEVFSVSGQLEVKVNGQPKTFQFIIAEDQNSDGGENSEKFRVQFFKAGAVQIINLEGKEK